MELARCKPSFDGILNTLGSALVGASSLGHRSVQFIDSESPQITPTKKDDSPVVRHQGRGLWLLSLLVDVRIMFDICIIRTDLAYLTLSVTGLFVFTSCDTTRNREKDENSIDAEGLVRIVSESRDHSRTPHSYHVTYLGFSPSLTRL